MKLNVAATICLALFSSTALAGGFAFYPTYTPGQDKERTQTTTSAYAGLVWTLKEKKSLVPDLTLGVRSLRVKSTDQVSGADLSTRINLSGGLALDSVRLSYVGGQRSALGTAGIGYSKTNSSVISSLAVQGPFSRLGVDYAFGPAKFSPYVEALTLDNPAKVRKISTPGTYSCAAYFNAYLYNNMCYTIP